MATLLAAALVLSVHGAPARQSCPYATITGYSAQMFPGRTADGTSTWGALASEDYIAAGPAWMRGRRIQVHAPDGVLEYRIADTGNLAAHGIDYDLLFATTAEALSWGRRSLPVCVQ